jgi:hypothetical protein
VALVAQEPDGSSTVGVICSGGTSLVDWVNSTDNRLNTLIIQAISRGAVTRYFISMDEMSNADVIGLHLLGFSLAAVLYLILVCRYHSIVTFISCLILMDGFSSSLFPTTFGCKHESASLIPGDSLHCLHAGSAKSPWYP